MSWSVNVRARKFAAPGEMKAAFAAARKQAEGSPMSQRVITLHERTAESFLNDTPHDCDITVGSYGHFDVGSGLGNTTLQLSAGQHVPPPAPKVAEVAQTEPALAVADETPVAAPDA